MDDVKRVLSPRQAECMRRVRALQSTDEIARDLQISTGTVNGYIRDAITALGARDRRHAALLFERVEQGNSDLESDVPDLSLGLLDQGPPLLMNVSDLPRSIVRDAATETPPGARESKLVHVLREIMDGARPEGWSMLTRSALVLAAVVVIGMAMLFMSASLGILYSLATGMRSAGS